LLIITYDEHGGYYDHVPPPVQGVPNPDGKIGAGIKFDRLGVRVPTIMISPWIKKGSVVHDPDGPFPSSKYEHSSVAATLKKLFSLKKFLTKRDEWAGTFEHVWMELDEPRKDCPRTLTEPTWHSLEKRSMVDITGPLTDMQEALVYMVAGLRNSTAEMMDKVQARNFVVEGWRNITLRL